MITKEIYVADDGEEFWDYHECLNHERAKNIAKVADSIFFFDEKGKKMEIDNLAEMLDTVFCVVCTKDETAAILADIYDDVGLTHPFGEGKAGTWYWDDYHGAWQSVEELIKTAKVLQKCIDTAKH